MGHIYLPGPVAIQRRVLRRGFGSSGDSPRSCAQYPPGVAAALKSAGVHCPIPGAGKPVSSDIFFLKFCAFFRIRWVFQRPRPPISVACMLAPMRHNPTTCAKNPGQFRERRRKSVIFGKPDEK
ncbi:hypothetical protein GDO81_026745 [Engystomops pustulosus]|uniref:Uncharacterized protein n=1 Tax=Engystomops pustulosus TaxID=76066 RepID=A0AAV6Z505_ENGPU|nr:hypothetical protein GDO81_026745 [Engystomops pustulosus]